MKHKKVAAPGPILLVGGGAATPADLATVRDLATTVVAADGGADSALAAGLRPDWVIGDLDSISGAARAALPPERVIHDPDQETTDFEKCLARIEAPLVLALGFTGRRVDHELAAFNTLVREAPGRILLIGAEDICLHLPAALALDLAPGTRVSLFPFAPVTGRSEGLEWPIDGLTFAPGGRIGTSNRATGPVRLETAGPGLVLILPRDVLPSVLAALAPR
ncbi:thiamine diphosphokinase [Oceaniglobus roseus]|uniref:thiamine diphosphokinase n=1 Tax=Oceaniglobus roseus TaxID=1737570 RepID=UPI000C7EA450|nr:thiamine diphosphokinase [Kandeliimicrobium roseum]